MPITAASPTSETSNNHELTVAPFAGWLVRPEWADRVISRAYDNLSPEQRLAITADNPYSYMNVTRSNEDLTAGPLSNQDLVTEAAAALTRLLEVGAFTATGRSALYLYRMTHDQGVQTGVVGLVPVRGFTDGRVRIHENVHDIRTELLTDHLQGVGATSSPVAMAVKSSPELSAELDKITRSVPADLEFGSSSVRHQVWTVPADHTDSLVTILDGQVLYVTDGHHRSAAATRALAQNPDDVALARTLAVVFPEDQLRVQAFYRLVVDQYQCSPEECLAKLSDASTMALVDNWPQAIPQDKGQVGVYLDGSWYQMTLPSSTGKSAVDQLDVERLRRSILNPVLGTDELTPDGTVIYLPASAGITGLVHNCDSNNRVGFVMHPMAVRELMAVADEGGLMPPKSSFFAPKPRSGVFLRVLGRGSTAHLPPS